MKIVDVRPDIDNLPHKFMTDDHGDWNRLTGPLVPIEDMNVCTADARPQDTDEDIVDADRGLGNILQPEAGIRMSFE